MTVDFGAGSINVVAPDCSHPSLNRRKDGYYYCPNCRRVLHVFPPPIVVREPRRQSRR